VEISYSQDGKDLDKLAWQYIQGSNGNIKAVIGIDISYGAKASTVSIWRPCYYREEGDELDTLDVRREVKDEVRDMVVMSWIVLNFAAISIFGRFPRESDDESATDTGRFRAGRILRRVGVCNAVDTVQAARGICRSSGAVAKSKGTADGCRCSVEQDIEETQTPV
jgi:hypothetical protein